MQIAMPAVFVTDMTEAQQAAGVDLRLVVAQQVNHGVAPLFLFKEQLPPDVVFDVKAAVGGAAKQVVEQRPVVIEERPQQLQALDLQLWQRKRE